MRYEYVELFAGAGGLSRGLEAAGFHCRAHAEIEPNARAVLRAKWGSTRLDGDVTQLHGADYAGITLLSGGSPCQDLSVAGKRAGLSGARSGLFYEQVRIWNESNAPYFLWENVYGALSSNAGADFAAVLSALVGTTVDVPTVRGKPKWLRAGVASGPTAVAAWRVLDLQHFGPPQRRVRVFVLAARTGGVDPTEVLAFGEGMCGHPSPRQQSREDAAAGVGGGAAGGGSGRAINISNGEPRVADTFATLQARSKAGGIGSGQQMQAVLQQTIGIDQERNAQVELMGTLNTGSKTGGGQLPVVMAFESTGGSWGVNEGDTAPPIKIGTGLGIASPPAVVAFSENQQARERTASGIGAGAPRGSGLTIGIDDEKNASQELMGTLKARTKSGGSSMAVVTFAERGREGGRSVEVREDGVPDALMTPNGGRSGTGCGDAVVAFHHTQTPISGDVAPAIGRTTDGMGVVCTTGDITHALTHEGADASEDGTGRGTPIVARMVAYSRGGYGEWNETESLTTLCARDANDGSSLVLPTLPASLANSATGQNRDELVIAQHGQYNATFDTSVAPTLTCLHEQPYLVKPEGRVWPKQIADTLTVAYADKQGLEDQHINGGAGLFQPTLAGRPRRLTPVECERLMSWPDDWTAVGVDEAGREYRLSDTARYRLCGNGVGSVQVAWIAHRLMAALLALDSQQLHP